MPEQALLFTDDRPFERFPRTRYQGSKRKTAAAIVRQLRDVEYDTVLDAFGGTGAVAYAFKCAGKQVTYNDILAFNHQIGLALIENNGVRLTGPEAEALLTPIRGVDYGDFIARTFGGIYFTDEENRLLDVAVGNIARIECRYRRALAWFALFQSAIAKRPYNLFHRRNLYMRTSDVERSFGNKASWDRPLEEHVGTFAAEASRAVVDTGRACRALCGDAVGVEGDFDLVYVDPPYISHAGVGVDYRAFYHFLEGLVHYDGWEAMIDRRSKHRRLVPAPDPWSRPQTVLDAFSRLVRRYEHSVVVVSYRADGIPSVDELLAALRHVKGRAEVVRQEPAKYALSTTRTTCEVLLVAP